MYKNVPECVKTAALSAELVAGAKSYANGRQYAACKGIASRLSGTGGKVRAGVISKARRPLCAHPAHSRRAQRDYARAQGQAPVAVAKQDA